MPTHSQEQLKAIFASFDTDGSGRLSMKELHKALHKNGKKVGIKEVSNIIKSVDDNNDGEVSFEEFEKVFAMAPDKVSMLGLQSVVDVSDSLVSGLASAAGVAASAASVVTNPVMGVMGAMAAPVINVAVNIAAPPPTPVLSNAGDLIPVPFGGTSGADCRFALSWSDVGGKKVDLDACAIALNPLGVVVDAAFFNNLSVLDGALRHHGDALDGKDPGEDEVIDIDIDGLGGKGVCCVAMCAFAQEGGTLGHAGEVTAFLKTAHRGAFKDAAIVPAGDGLGERATGVCVAVLFTPDGGSSWSMRRMGQTFVGPTDFLEAETDLVRMCMAAGVITKVPPPAGTPVVTASARFNMSKGEVATMGSAVDHVYIGLGWEMAPGLKLDLDASCIMLGPRGKSGYRTVVDVVWHNDTQAPGVTHSGDQRSGAASGDDEKISLKLSALARNVERVVVVINAFHGSFGGITKAWARVVDPKTSSEMVRYDLEAQRASGVVVCAFEKVQGKWIFEAIGEACDGRSAKAGETMDAVRGRPFRAIPNLKPGESIVLPSEMYDDDDDTFTIVDEWGCRDAWVWLDASLLLFDKSGRKVGEIDFNDKSFAGGVIVHSGDKQDEKKAHGSHTIVIRMKRLTEQCPTVFSVLLVLSAYTQDLTKIVKPFVSMRDSDDAVIARVADLDTNYKATSITMCDIHRHPRLGWVLTSHGLLGEGKANKYGPMEADYRVLLKQIVTSVDRGEPTPTMDYRPVTESYVPGPPLAD